MAQFKSDRHCFFGQPPSRFHKLSYVEARPATKYVSSSMSDTSDDELDLEAVKAQLKRQKREIKEKHALIADRIADQDALIADQDALIADQGAKIVDQDALIAARNALIADQNAQLDCSRWLTLDEITETMQPSADSSKYSEACKSFKEICTEYAGICYICNHDFNMQNMQEYALPTLLMMLKL